MTTWPGRLGGAVLAVFVAAGTIKASPVFGWLPFDLTAACAVVIVLLSAHAVIWSLRRSESLRALWWLAGAYALFGIGLVRAGDSLYTHEKVAALWTLTLGCAFGGGLLLARTSGRAAKPRRLSRAALKARTPDVYGVTAARDWLLWATIAVGLTVAVLYRLAPTTDSSLLGRYALEGSNTIAPGRYAGAALVAVLALTLTRRLRMVWALPMLAACLVMLLGAGSRGPLVAAAAASVAMLPLLIRRRRIGRAVIVAAAGVLGVSWLFGRIPVASQHGIELLFAQNKGVSVTERQDLWSTGWAVFMQQPFGVGWGGLQPWLYPNRYPHNIVVEVAGEGGVIVLAGLVLLLVVAYVRAYRHARMGDVTAVAFVGLLTFWLVNALVSGDLNDNRGLFVFAAACVALGTSHGRAGRVLPVGAVRPDRLPERRVEDHRASASGGRSGP